ncbi:phosphohydrolase [Flaviaesturariibacter flavus]|uniref:Phosphohydrolase n=1 Tax=Flaviaesturariibacter flavus TaxID=2502780 RepID=A0A4R1BMV7_9BACT|nr:Pycsar system effector family protein [Flaviaesturariibacter flavus]TCJ18745.1 phosphohydrolase [Flaviaesturariibacter flavus]
MTDQQLSILAAAQEYVTNLFRQKVDPKFVFHNLGHTQQVVAAAHELASHHTLSDEDEFVLFLSAWFHDTGFASGKAEEHEKESTAIATAFLTEKGVEEPIIQRVSSCIQATRMPQSPLSIVEKILCDADLYHLGGPDFKKMNAQLRAEQEAYLGRELPKKEWRQRNIEFLETHQYFTEWAQEHREPRKQVWLREMRKKQGDKEVKHTPTIDVSPYAFDPELPAGGDKEKKDSRESAAARSEKERERTVQTMFRLTAENHIHLSSQADSKAHIMISVNSIIISIMFSVLLGRLEYYPHLAIPTLLLAAVCVTTIVYSVLATRPSINSGLFTEDDIRNRRTNLLFFGNFHKMELEKYNWAMNQLINDGDYMYSSLIKDNYFLGLVLAKKYRYLRISYTIFMFGLVAAVIAFIASYFLAGQ